MGFGKGNKGVIMTDTDTITMLTTGNNIVVKQDNPLVLQEDFRLVKTEFSARWTGTAGDADGFHMYLADNELSVTEIGEAITAAGPLDRNDRDLDEKATRPVFLLGLFVEDGVGAQTRMVIKGPASQVGIIEKTIRWTFSDTEGFCFAIFNNSGAAPTTGGVIRVVAKHFGVWVT